MHLLDAACYVSLATALTVFIVDGPGITYPPIKRGVIIYPKTGEISVHPKVSEISSRPDRSETSVVHTTDDRITFSGFIDLDNLTHAVRNAAQKPDRTVTVEGSDGGRILGAVNAIRLAQETGVRFRILGGCHSACSLLLGVPGSCADGYIAGHSAHDGNGNRNVPATSVMRQFYPKAIDDEFVRLGAYYKLPMTYISPPRLRELGIPACD